MYELADSGDVKPEIVAEELDEVEEDVDHETVADKQRVAASNLGRKLARDANRVLGDDITPEQRASARSMGRRMLKSLEASIGERSPDEVADVLDDFQEPSEEYTALPEGMTPTAAQQMYELFGILEEERGSEVSFYAQEIYRNIQDALESGRFYLTDVVVENYDGSGREILNSCVGFVMSAFAGLPFKVASGENENCYLSAYGWGKTHQTPKGKDGMQHFIPDCAGEGEPPRYTDVQELDPESIDEQVGQHLAVGEYAVAAFMNHVFLIYKDGAGVVKMVHSGAVVNEQGKRLSAPGKSRVNETTLAGYAKYMKRRYPRLMQFRFLPISEIVAASEERDDREVYKYYSFTHLTRRAA
ncbi:hypothetical protein KJ742_01275 [Patescibacteria group bacterium]|nr:hypothetical protein [Patescibacteria group bacterium]MBU1682556.1 hypothetical protein [Patescibacteria group bacterium]MBU1935477.1 hypothetical protein [Patescibacteria group bacterium]